MFLLFSVIPVVQGSPQNKSVVSPPSTTQTVAGRGSDVSSGEDDSNDSRDMMKPQKTPVLAGKLE